jgi:poly(3-hydroxybutyrate) depolymerase
MSAEGNMLSLRKSIASLARNRGKWEKLMRAGRRAYAPDPGAMATRLDEVHGFGSNPGNLRMYRYVPPRLDADPALVVVLHGCTQTAAGYDLGAGWSTLADRYGFVVLLPEQQRSTIQTAASTGFSPATSSAVAGRHTRSDKWSRRWRSITLSIAAACSSPDCRRAGQ